MIELTTLFLGFVLGVRTVEVAVDARVAAVELHLDGRLVAELAAPPWSAQVDFGRTLAPRRFEALAFDATGRLLERTRRLVNYSRSDYGATLALDPAAGGAPRTGRVIWAAVLDRDPERLDLSFDARPLAVAADGRFVLPPHDAGENHFLEAELTFVDGHTIRAEMSFGDAYGERVVTALTAIPLASPAGRPWPAAAVRGWLEHEGEGVEVFAARAREGLLLVVRDERVDKEVRRLRRRLGVGEIRLERERLEVTAVSPRPLKTHDGTFQVVELGRPDFGLGALLTEDFRFFRREKRTKKQHLWDAVALAGRHAAVSNRPRAVLLMVGEEPRDASVLRREQAAHYLESVRVPLFVWASSPGALDRLGLAAAPRAFSGGAGLEEAARRVAVELASQTMVWLVGEYLPAEISLGGAAPEGVELVR